METGKVRVFDEKKGYGFITTSELDELLFYKSDVANNAILDKDDNVEFNIITDSKGDHATDIRKL